jgi:hypothetical protein
MFSCFTTAHAFFGFNKKAEGPEGVEYYILGDNLANEIDTERTREVDINKPEEGFSFYDGDGILYLSRISSSGRRETAWHSQELVENILFHKNIRRFKLASADSRGTNQIFFLISPDCIASIFVTNSWLLMSSKVVNHQKNIKGWSLV